jgi:asparagine synthase (glutamine-hydrolysing)
VSGIVGLFNLDGRPADGRLVGRMLRAIGDRGPDASRVWSSGAVGLGHCLLATTPESVGEVQPHVAADGLSIVFDGRLDNRDELAEEFARARLPLTAGFDAAFVAAAYRRWGVECAARLLGDFAFAIWDPRERRMFCARDVMAQKPFYYHRGASTFLFASEPQALLRHPSVSRRPNEGMVAECLSIITSTDDTLFADVQRLPRAHRLVVTPDAFTLEKYWEIDTARTIRYRTDDEYFEHFRALLRQVVGARLRSSTNVGVQLSGGVDSSSITATATELRRSGEAAVDCDAYSLVELGELDEKEFIDRAVARIGCASHQFKGSTFPVDAYRAATRRRTDLASSPNARLIASLKTGARRQGVRVLLSGVGSDEWFGGSCYHLADLFASLRWVSLASFLGTVARHPEFELPRPAVKVMTWALLSRAMRKRIKGWIGRDGVPPWIRRDFADRVSLADRLYPGDPDQPFPTVAQRNIYRDMMSGATIHCIEDEERSSAEFGVEVRYPFADRRIMEFGLAIPETLRWRGPTRKFIVREAMREHLPAEIRRRRSSPDAGSVFMPTLDAFAAEGLFDQPAIEREGWTVPGEVRAYYDRIAARRASGDPDYTVDVWPMWIVSAVELWMREVVDRQAADEKEEAWDGMMTASTSAI